MMPPTRRRRLAAPLAVLLAVCVTGGSGSEWTDLAEAGDLVDDLSAGQAQRFMAAQEERQEEGLVLVGLINAHPSYHSQCKACKLLADVMAEAAESHKKGRRRARKAGGGGGGGKARVIFSKILYAQSTVPIIKANKAMQVPALFLVTPGAATFADAHVFSMAALEGLELREAAEKAAAAAVAAGDDSQAAPAQAAPAPFADVTSNRRTRRRLLTMTSREIDGAVYGAQRSVSLETVAAWVSLLAGVPMPVPKPEADGEAEKVAEAAAAAPADAGVAVSPVLLVLILVGAVTFVAFVYRAFHGPAEADEDEMQTIVRMNGTWLTLCFHIFLVAGIHWCLLHKAQLMGDGKLFQPGRRGQYIFEGFLVAGYFTLGAYSFLALHRIKEHLAFPESLLFVSERVSQGGAENLLYVAGLGIAVAVALGIVGYMHKSYYYLSGTILRKALLLG